MTATTLMLVLVFATLAGVIAGAVLIRRNMQRRNRRDALGAARATSSERLEAVDETANLDKLGKR